MRGLKQIGLSTGTALAGILALAPQQAYAQAEVNMPGDSDDEAGRFSDEIVVTARRREESLQDVPVAVSAFSSEALFDAQVESLVDLNAKVPNLNVSFITSASTAIIYLRGAGQDDTNPVAARLILGSSAIIGVTCHDSLALAEQAIKDTANYIAFGRFFPSSTKPDARPAPVSLISEARAKFGATPIAVIGGITLDNGQQLLDAGADMLAVCHSLFSADDVTAQAKKFIELI